jgi:polysaccharide pyruvyl transferase CsaB
VRVLLSGYYGFGNAGDEALLEGLLTGLGRFGHRPRVLSAHPRWTTALHGAPAAHRVRDLPQALAGARALVSGGGGLLQDKTSAWSLRYYLLLIKVARALGKRVVVYGQSVGPLSEAGRLGVARSLRGVPIAVRDLQSVELLAELGLPSTLVGDPALLLEPRPIASRFEGRLAARSTDRSATQAATQLAGNAGAQVLLVPRAGHPDLSDALAALGGHYLARGCPVGLLPLHMAEDGGEGQRLQARLPAARLLRPGDHREALAWIAGARLVASARLHGLILAATAGTPFVGLVYDPKVAGFLAQAGGLGFETPVDHRRLIRACEELASLPSATREELRRRAEDGIAWLDAALRGRS